MTEQNKAVVRRLFDEMWNTGQLDKIEELYAPDFVADYRPYVPLRVGHEGIRETLSDNSASFQRHGSLECNPVKRVEPRPSA